MHGWQSRIATNLLIASFALPLAIFAGGSVFARLQADDYCLMAAAQQQGVLPTLANTYNGWSGRFTATFLTAILGLTGPVGATLLLICALAVWAVASYGLLYEALSLVHMRLPRMWTVGAALLIITGILAALPYVEQVLYWLTGVVAYTLPLALFTLLLWLLLRLPQVWWARLAAALLALFIAGCSDTLAPLQVVILGILLIILWRREHRIAVLFTLACALMGLLIVLAAPGNAVRVESAGATPSLTAALATLPQAIRVPMYFLTANSPLVVLAAWLLPALAAFDVDRRRYLPQSLVLLLLGIPAFTFTMVGIAFLPSLYVLNTISDPRTWIFGMWIVLLGILAFGYVCGLTVRHVLSRYRHVPKAMVLVAGLLALGSILTASLAASAVVTRQRAFAEAWDVRDAFLRTQSGAQEAVRAQSFHGAMGLGDLTDDPAYWVNGCIAAYYGLPAIVKDDAEPIAP